jgi:hypothetical protein
MHITLTSDVAEMLAAGQFIVKMSVESNANHTLHEMLSPINKHKYNVGKRPHNHQLPSKGNLLQRNETKNSEIRHCLYFRIKKERQYTTKNIKET